MLYLRMKQQSFNGALNIPTEEQEQMKLIEWTEIMTAKWPELVLLHHIPNGGYRTPVEAAKFKALGVKRGVPDIHLPVARGGYHGLYIEMKRTEGGVLSEDQKWWLKALGAQGYCSWLCDGCDKAIEVIEKYLEGRLTKNDSKRNGGVA